MLFLGASSGPIKALDFSETIEKLNPHRERSAASSSAHPRPGTLSHSAWKISLFLADRTPFPSIQMSAIVGVIAGSSEEKVSAH